MPGEAVTALNGADCAVGAPAVGQQRESSHELDQEATGRNGQREIEYRHAC